MRSLPQVVAFTKDWSDLPTCTTHILRQLAQNHAVLWVNSIGIRRPSLARARDWRRMLERVRRLGAAPVPVEANLWVLAPALVPAASSQAAIALNRALLRWAVDRWRSGVGPGGRVAVWSFVPTAGDYVDALGATTVVYYCADDWSGFRGFDADLVSRKEQALLQKVDVAFATSRYLVAKLAAKTGAPVHYLPHGVDHAQFAVALRPETQIPPDLAVLPRPRIGFYGTIDRWLDSGLLAELAAARPEWSFALLGPVYCDVRPLQQGHPNLHFLGRREHPQLPAYCRGFDAAIIPYDLGDPRMESVNPVKARELLAAGVPVVASQLPELECLTPDVLRAAGLADWLAALDRQIARTDRDSISERRRGDGWAGRVGRICECIASARPTPAQVNQ